MLAFHLALLEWLAGNPEQAERYTAAAQAMHQAGDDQVDAFLLWLEAFVAARHGELDRARVQANEATALASRVGDHFTVAWSTTILAETELRTGHPDRAHQRLADLREAIVGGNSGFVGSLTLPFWWCDIEALIAVGELDDASAVLNHLFERARRAENPNAIAIAYRCEGLLLAARSNLTDAINAMHHAIIQHTQRPLPFELGRTLLEKGTLERRSKRKSAAKQSLTDAVSILQPLSARLWIARAHDELSRVGLRRAAVAAGLTPAQQRVAELVTSGMTNREIAGTLYMSVRTVETHLTKIYRELGVKTRAQLIAATRTSETRNNAPGYRL
jgi:DNA-binding CsgD family transcriptional regulator